VAADPAVGVWAYGAIALSEDRAQPYGRLRHLALEGDGPESTLTVLPDGPPEEQVPRLANPVIAVGPDSTVWLAGETGAGDVLSRIKAGAVEVIGVPCEISRGRRIRAVDVGGDGLLYVATDGAGVLTYRDGKWGVHPITEHLPVLEGSDLKPVDDILVTDDGTVYAACQFQVVIWKPDEAQP